MAGRRIAGCDGAGTGGGEIASPPMNPPIETAADEALRDYIARRERDIPAMDALNQEF